MKRKSAGLYLTILAVLLGAACAVAYFINCQTDYFATFGISTVLIGCLGAGIAAHILTILTGWKGNKAWADIFPVAASVLFMAVAVQFIGIRINEIAFILTFQKNANTLADMQSAIAGIGLCLAATVISWISSFFDIA